MYSRGILGSCFWNRDLSPVSKIEDLGEPSLLTTSNLIIPACSSSTAGRSRLTGAYGMLAM